MADSGSAIPVIIPVKNAFVFGMPAEYIGRDIDAPSGIFCMPMPMANTITLARVDTGLSPTSANAMPTDIPSGILCRVIDKFSIFSDWSATGVESFFSKILAHSIINANPHKNPSPTHRQDIIFRFSQYDMAGSMSEKYEADNIIPLAKLIINALNLVFGFLKKNTNALPNVVQPNVNSVHANV